MVAAYKMGMVHEKPQLITRRQLTGPDSMRVGAAEPNTTIEIRDGVPGNLGVEDGATVINSGGLASGGLGGSTAINAPSRATGTLEATASNLAVKRD